jgi:hypothetical protein
MQSWRGCPCDSRGILDEIGIGLFSMQESRGSRPTIFQHRTCPLQPDDEGEADSEMQACAPEPEEMRARNREGDHVTAYGRINGSETLKK